MLLHRQLPLRHQGRAMRPSRKRCTPISRRRVRSTTGCATSASSSAPSPDDLVPFEKYAAAAQRADRVRPRPRARSATARPTSSAPTSWCSSSRRRRACATPSSTRRSHWSTRGSRPTGRRPPPDADRPAPIRAFGRSAAGERRPYPPDGLAARSARPFCRIIAAWIGSAPSLRPVPRPARAAAARILPRCAEAAERLDWGKSDFSSAGRG